MATLNSAFPVRKSSRSSSRHSQKEKSEDSSGESASRGRSSRGRRVSYKDLLSPLTPPRGGKSPDSKAEVKICTSSSRKYGNENQPTSVSSKQTVFESPVSSLCRSPSESSSPLKLCDSPVRNSPRLSSPTPSRKIPTTECKLSPSSTVTPTKSPSKRKSNDENGFVETVSPVKSSRKSLREGSTPTSSKQIPLGVPRAASITPRRLFGSPEKKSSSSPIQSRAADEACQLSKRTLHSSYSDRLIGREAEEAELESFIKEGLEKKTGRSVYISGAPGTGKTAVVTRIMEQVKKRHKDLPSAYINCMTVRESSQVYSQLHQQLTGLVLKAKDSAKAMEKLVTSSRHSLFLVLDEIDQLDSKQHEILYTIFEWSGLQNSKLILIGIANAFDLTDRVLPRLKASKRCKPKLVNFAPYSASQIAKILESRVGINSVLEPTAITFCARKIASVAGDMRKALDVCHRAVEVLESEVRSQKVLKPTDCNSPSKKNVSFTKKKVTVAHISQVVAEVYGSSTSRASSSESEVPLQQKLAVCSLLVLMKTAKLKEVLFGKLHETYIKVCKRQQMMSVDQGEFHSVCSLLESRGILAMKKAKDTRMIKVSLKVDEQELEQILKDEKLISAILKAGIP